MEIGLNPSGNALGARMSGVDLSQPVPQALASRIKEALAEHIVLVIEDQTLTPAEYVRAMSALGTPGRQNHADQLHAEHPEIWIIDSRTSRRNESGVPLPFGSNCWHTDHTNLPAPPRYTALYAVQLPPSGGDTRFANGYALYDRLPQDLRSRADSARVVYGADRHLPVTAAEKGAFDSPAVHPMVRTHPVTGKRALYVHPLKAQRIEGLSPDESFAFIDQCLDAALDDAVIHTHVWSPRDLVIIDNSACLHLAVKNYDTEAGRVMHRMIIAPEVPHQNPQYTVTAGQALPAGAARETMID